MIAFLMVIEDDMVRDKLEEIYNLYNKDMFVTAYSILKDYHEAQDVVQSVILRLAKNLHKITDVKCKKTRSYLVIIVRNLSFDVYNKRRGSLICQIDEFSWIKDDDVDIDNYIIRMEDSRKMAELLNSMYQPYGDILTLRYYNELSVPEIAVALDISTNNVSVRLNRALKALKSILDKGGSIDEKTI